MCVCVCVCGVSKGGLFGPVKAVGSAEEEEWRSENGEVALVSKE